MYSDTQDDGTVKLRMVVVTWMIELFGCGGPQDDGALILR